MTRDHDHPVVDYCNATWDALCETEYDGYCRGPSLRGYMRQVYVIQEMKPFVMKVARTKDFERATLLTRSRSIVSFVRARAPKSNDH